MGPKQPDFAWVEYDPRGLKERRAAGVYNQQRKVVRAHVAHTSSDRRKATIARNESLAKAQGVQKQRLTKLPTRKRNHDEDDSLASLFTRLRSHDATTVAYMAQKSDRVLLWNAFTGGNTCFEAAMFVSGTFSNTCGISRHELHTGFGSGLLFLRGASLEGIQSTIVHSPKDSLNSISIALLAGWERRFGDQATYEVHLQAWKALPLTVGSLEDGSIAALSDAAMYCFREAAQERYLTESSFSIARSLVYGTVLPEGLPIGFHIVPTDHPEALSLLGTVAKCASFDPAKPGSVQRFRRHVLEIMSWSASHSLSTEPVDAYEDSWDQTDLKALYHIRSAMISANGPTMFAAIDAHNIKWTYDVQTGLDIHAEACQNLRSLDFVGTKYQDIVIWAQMTMTSHATPSEGLMKNMRALLNRVGIRDWAQMEALLKRHVYLPWAQEKYQRFFDALFPSGSTTPT